MLISLLGVVITANGAAYTWNGAGANQQGSDASGTWDTSTANWSITGDNNIAWLNDGTSDAVFGESTTANDGPGPWTVSLGAIISAQSITFANPGSATA